MSRERVRLLDSLRAMIPPTARPIETFPAIVSICVTCSCSSSCGGAPLAEDAKESAEPA